MALAHAAHTGAYEGKRTSVLPMRMRRLILRQQQAQTVPTREAVGAAGAARGVERSVMVTDPNQHPQPYSSSLSTDAQRTQQPAGYPAQPYPQPYAPPPTIAGRTASPSPA